MTRAFHHQQWIHRLLGKYATTRAVPQSSPRAFRVPAPLRLGLKFTIPISLHRTSAINPQHSTSHHTTLIQNTASATSQLHSLAEFSRHHLRTHHQTANHHSAIHNLLTQQSRAFTQSLRITTAASAHMPHQQHLLLRQTKKHIATHHNATSQVHNTATNHTTATMTTTNLIRALLHRQTTRNTANLTTTATHHQFPQLTTLLQHTASQLAHRTTQQFATLFSRSISNTTLHLSSSQATHNAETHTYALAAAPPPQAQLRVQKESILRQAEHTATEIIRREFQTLDSTRSAVTTLTRDDYGEIANRVETLLTRRLLIERERRGVHA